MDLRKLHHCVVVAELGSFTRAAAVLGMPQSVLSRHMRDIETVLGIILLRRTGRGVVPTDAGAHLLPSLRALVASHAAVMEEVRRFQDRPSGVVRLGMLAALGPIVLTPLLNRAFEELPGVQIQVIEALTDHLEELLAAGRVDLAVIYDSRPVANPMDEPLMNILLHLVGPRGDPVTARESIPLRELGSLPLALPARPNRLRMVIEQACREQKVRLDVRTSVDAIVTLRDVPASGRSYSILPPYFVAADVVAGRLQACRIVDPPIRRQALLATADRGRMSQAAAAVAVLIRTVFREMMQSGQLDGEACRAIGDGSENVGSLAASGV